jgi:predicted MFS family arabinose efflux permease
VVIPVGAGSPRRATVVGTVATVVASLPVFFTAAMAVQLRADLGFGTVGIGAAVGSFFGTMALSSMYLGRVADRLGATVSLRSATLGVAAASFGIAGLSRDWIGLVIGLVVAGLAAALAQPAANRLLINRVRGARLGTAFGLKQSAPPTASMLAGLAVPAVALTVGWRWAYVVAGACALLVAVAVGPRPPNAPERVRRTDRSRPAALPHRATLVLLAVSFGLAFAASSVVLAFYVDSAVAFGIAPERAGLVFAAASLTAITTRLLAGAACDRYAFAPLRLCGALLGAGALGIALLAVGRPITIVSGAVVALAGTWGFPGVFWYALVRAYPATPGRITGTMAPAALGGVIGPVGFGAVATDLSYTAAWSLASAIAVLAAVAMLYGARRLAIAESAGGG